MDDVSFSSAFNGSQSISMGFSYGFPMVPWRFIGPKTASLGFPFRDPPGGGVVEVAAGDADDRPTLPAGREIQVVT